MKISRTGVPKIKAQDYSRCHDDSFEVWDIIPRKSGWIGIEREDGVTYQFDTKMNGDAPKLYSHITVKWIWAIEHNGAKKRHARQWKLSSDDLFSNESNQTEFEDGIE